MKSPRNRWFIQAAAWLMAISTCLPSATADSPAPDVMKPMAIVTLNGYDQILEDVNFVGTMMGQPQAAQQLEMMLQMFTQNKGLAGLDKTRPLGAFVISDGANFQGALCLPVTDCDALLEVLEPFGISVEDQEDGIQPLSVGGTPLYLRCQGPWAFVSPLRQSLRNLPDDPGSYFTPMAEQYDIGIQVMVQNVPENFRQLAIAQLSQGMEAVLKKLPNEEDQDYALRKSVAEAQLRQITRMIEEIDKLTLGVQLDGNAERAVVDLAFTPVQETDLAKQIADYGDAKTNYAGFFQPDAAMTLSFASKITKEESAQFNQMFGTIRKQVMKSIDDRKDLPSDDAREAMKSASGDFLDALKETVEAGVMDGGAVLNLTPESLTLVAGGFVGDPGKVENGLKKIAELAQGEAKFPGIEWNDDSHGDIQFHTMSIPVPESQDEPRQLFGETLDVAIGIGKQSVYFSLGKNCLDAVKQVIDASLANPDKSIAPAEMTVSLGQIMAVATAFAKEKDKGRLEMIASALEGESSGRDHLRLVLQPIDGGGLRYRLEAEEGVLRAFGMAAMAAQSQGAQSQRAQAQGAQAQGAER